MPVDGVRLLREAPPAAVADRRRVQALSFVFSLKLLDVVHWLASGQAERLFQPARGGSLCDSYYKLV